MSDEILKAGHTELSHQFTHLFSYERQIVDQELWSAGKLGLEVFALGSDTSRAGIEMTLTRHITAQRDECSGAKPKLFSTQHCANNHIAPSLESSIDAYTYAPAQPVAYQHLLGLCQ